MSITKNITGYLKYISQKICHNPSPQIILDGLNKLGINIMPFYVFSENLSNNTTPHLGTGLDEYDTGLLGPEDMREIAEIPFRNIPEETLLKRLNDGKLCFGMKYHGKIIAFSWCDPKGCEFKGYNVPLREDEAYLFDAYTLPSFRGKGLLPYLRYYQYMELAKSGKCRFYSISEYFNTAAIRFKEKLGAKKIGTGLLIGLFHKWHLNLRLKRDHTISSITTIPRGK
jgi:GNAT superfamily N-acetyltransferase